MRCGVFYVVSPTRHTHTGGWSRVKKNNNNKIKILDVQMSSRKALLAILKSNLKKCVKVKIKSLCTAINTVKHINTTKIINKSSPTGVKEVRSGLKSCAVTLIFRVDFPHSLCFWLNQWCFDRREIKVYPDVFFYKSLLVLAAITWQRRWSGLLTSWLWLSFGLQLSDSRSLNSEDHESTPSPFA